MNADGEIKKSHYHILKLWKEDLEANLRVC